MPLTLDTSQFDAAIKRLAGLPPATRRQAFGTFASYMEGELNRRAPWKTGGTRAFRGAYDDNEARIGTPTIFARIMHYGGTIHAGGHPEYKAPAPPLQSKLGKPSEVHGKAPKYLAIPINAEKNKRPRDYMGHGTFVAKGPKGLFIGQRINKAGKLTRRSGAKTLGRNATKDEKKQGFRVLFVLRESVTIQAKPYAEPDDLDVATFGDIVTKAMDNALGG